MISYNLKGHPSYRIKQTYWSVVTSLKVLLLRAFILEVWDFKMYLCEEEKDPLQPIPLRNSRPSSNARIKKIMPKIRTLFLTKTYICPPTHL